MGNDIISSIDIAYILPTSYRNIWNLLNIIFSISYFELLNGHKTRLIHLVYMTFFLLKINLKIVNRIKKRSEEQNRSLEYQ